MALTPEGAIEMAWDCDGLRLAGLSWGEVGAAPVLALHGWLDNAASFARLAPALAAGHHVVAPDLSGHGQSDRRSADATYNVYDDLPQLHALVRQLGWDRFALLGHSRGAIISALYAACFSEQVSHLVLLDGVAPPPLREGAFVEQLRNFVTDRERLLSRSNRVFQTIADAVTVREEQGLDRRSAELIARRNLKACEGGYTWSTDPRLRGASAAKMTRAQVDSMLAALPPKTLLLMAQQGLAATHPKRFDTLAGSNPNVVLEEVPGGHHFHMQEGVDTLADRITRFLDED
jgi:pimeloyl-ACP methyl ester carboxylesterase